MAQNTLADLSTTAASNTDFRGQSIQGTATVSTIDSMLQNLAAMLARFYDDIGATGTVGGTADAITLTSGSSFGSLANGNVVWFKAASNNTGAATINVDALGAKAIRRQGDSALQSGDILANGVYGLRYDTAYNSAAGAWVILNPTASIAAASTTTAGAIEIATSAEFRTGTDTTRGLGVAETWGAAGEVSLADGTTVALDLSTGINFTVTLGGNRTLGNPTNPKVGQSGYIRIVQDGTGSRTLAYSSYWKFANGAAPTLTTTASAQDLLFYVVYSSTAVFATLVKAVA